MVMRSEELTGTAVVAPSKKVNEIIENSGDGSPADKPAAVNILT